MCCWKGHVMDAIRPGGATPLETPNTCLIALLLTEPFAGTQAYVRRLEGRLLSVRHAAELEQHCGQLKSQVAWLGGQGWCHMCGES